MCVCVHVCMYIYILSVCKSTWAPPEVDVGCLSQLLFILVF